LDEAHGVQSALAQEQFQSLVAFVSRHVLFKDALLIYKDDSERLKVRMPFCGSFL
jgi:hypothetical protein